MRDLDLSTSCLPQCIRGIVWLNFNCPIHHHPLIRSVIFQTPSEYSCGVYYSRERKSEYTRSLLSRSFLFTKAGTGG